MTIGKMKPVATIVAQFAAGVEVEAIQHDGKVFLPVIGLGEFATKGDDAPAHHTPTTAAPTSKNEDKGDDTTTSKVYTEDELMDTDTKELMRICKDEFGIDPNDTDGKNTNKKLRMLILDAQENGDGVDKTKEEAPTTKKPSKSAKSDKKDDDEDGDGDDLTDKVADLLEDFDAGKKNKKKTIAAIVALGDDDVDEDKVTELVEHFDEDGDADLDETAKDIVDVLNGKVEKKPAKKSPKRGKKNEDEDLVDVDDLEVGDRVSVWWDDDNQEWFDGEVKSIKKGKVTIAYDDDTEDVIDPEINTKIKKLAE